MVTTGQYAISSQAVSPWYNTGSQYRTREAQDVRVENGAGLIVGHTAQETISIDGATDLVPEVQVLGTAAADATVMLAAFSTTATIAGSPILAFVKGGNASIGSHTVVTDGEELGNIVAYGDDGTDLEAIAAQIQFEVDGTPGTGDMPGRIILATTADGAETATERMRINSSGDVIIGHTTSLNIGAGATTALQVLGTAFADSGISIGRFDSGSSGPSLRFVKSKHGSIVGSSGTILINNDILGDIIFAGDDGVDLRTIGAKIQAAVDGTPSAADGGQMPSRLGFWTSVGTGGAAATERVRIAADGGVFAYNLLAASASTDVNINGSDELHSVTSSEYYKYDKRTLEIDSSLIYQLQPRSYKFGAKKPDAPADWPMADGEADDWGLTAEEVYEVLPELVNLKNGRPYSVRYSMLSVLLLNEIKKLREAA